MRVLPVGASRLRDAVLDQVGEVLLRLKLGVTHNGCVKTSWSGCCLTAMLNLPCTSSSLGVCHRNGMYRYTQWYV